MNANELADINEWSCCAHSKEVSAMLRQQQAEIERLKDQYQRLNENLEMWKAGHFKQQAEIEALKQNIDANNLSQNIGQFVKPANEPVAWAIKSDGDWTEIGWDDEVLHEVEEWYTAQGWQYEYVPLYTHPAKTLTDEEIIELFDHPDDFNCIDFARAILRKANEK